MKAVSSWLIVLVPGLQETSRDGLLAGRVAASQDGVKYVIDLAKLACRTTHSQGDSLTC